MCEEGMKTLVTGQPWGLEDSELGFHAVFPIRALLGMTHVTKATVPHTQQDSKGSLFPIHVLQGGCAAGWVGKWLGPNPGQDLVPGR